MLKIELGLLDQKLVKSFDRVCNFGDLNCIIQSGVNIDSKILLFLRIVNLSNFSYDKSEGKLSSFKLANKCNEGVFLATIFLLPQ